MKTPHKKLHELVQDTGDLVQNIDPLETGQRARLRANILRAHIELINVHRRMHQHNIGLALIPNAHPTEV